MSPEITWFAISYSYDEAALISVPDIVVMERKVVRSLSRIHELGVDLRAQYVSQTLDTVTVPMSNTIRRNEILTFGNRPDLNKTKQNESGTEDTSFKIINLITQLFLSV